MSLGERRPSQNEKAIDHVRQVPVDCRMMQPASNPFQDRARLSAGIDYVLRLMRVYTNLVGGDPTRALVFIASAQAVTQHLNRRGIEANENGFAKDEMRRPVSLSALARSLGLSIETTRRHVLALVEQGLVTRVEGGGVLVTSQELNNERVRAAVLDNNVNLAKLLSDLAVIS